jgi:WD40 repeat protein
MPWPLSQDYNEAVQTPQVSFSDPDLRTSKAAVNALGLPLPCSGNFADVYRLTLPDGSRSWAVKCFTRQVPNLRERYREVGLHLEQARLPFTVDFAFLNRGVRVGGDWYPAVKMEWVEGLLLNQFVKGQLDNPPVLEALCQLWIKLAGRLREADIAHCDLQHGNVLLVPGNKPRALVMRLIDYDGMWVPALAGKKSGEVGHPAYQHPQRLREGTYSLEVDRFSHLVIYTALRALLAGGRPLWERYDNGDNLLFRQADFAAPRASGLFRELLALGDPELRLLAQGLAIASQKPLEQTPLLEEVASAGDAAARVQAAGQQVVPASTVPVAQPLDFTRGAGAVRPRSRAGRTGRPSTAALVAGVVAACALLAGLALGAAWLWKTPGMPPALPNPIASGSGSDRNQVPGPTDPARPVPVDKGEREPKPLSPDGKEVPKQTSPAPPQPAPVDKGAQTPKEPPPAPPEPVDAKKARMQPREPTFTLTGHTSWVISVFYSPDGSRLASVGRGTVQKGLPGEVKVWDVNTGQEVHTLKGHSSIVNWACYSPDGTRLASAAADGMVKVWDPSTGREVHTLKGAGKDVRRVCFSSDGMRLAGAGNDGGVTGTVQIWDVSSGRAVLRLKFDGFVRSLCYSPDGTRIAIASDGFVQNGAVLPGEILVWDARTGQKLFALRSPHNGFSSVCFSPDSMHIATSSNGHFDQGKFVAGEVQTWDARTGEKLLSFLGHTGGAMRVWYSPDGKYLASAGGDSMAMVWNASTGRTLLQVKEGGGVVSACLSPDGKRLATTTSRPVKVWEVEANASEPSSRLPMILNGQAAGLALMSFSPDGRTLASGSLDGSIRLWDVTDNKKPLEKASSSSGPTKEGQFPDTKPGPAPPLAVAPFDAREAHRLQQAWAKHPGIKAETANSIGMTLAPIPAGSFLMGSPESEPGHTPPERQQKVEITRPFLLGIHEVTQEEYQRVTGHNPSWFSPTGGGKDKVAGMDTGKFPVDQVSWYDAAEFCRKLSALPAEKMARRVYRLPSDAEWEFACRAGTTTAYAFGATLSPDQANMGGKLLRTAAVGSYRPSRNHRC